MDYKLTCTLTGHRELKEDFDAERLKSLIVELVKKGVKKFYCGMAVGFDLIAARCVLDIKKQIDGVQLSACIPCRGQERYYSDEMKKEYSDILSECDEAEVLSEKYFKGCMIVRDRFMVDRSDCVLAYLYRSSGGTAYTVKYARSLKKEIYLL